MRGASRRVAGCTSDDSQHAGVPGSPDPAPEISIPPECEIDVDKPEGFRQASHRHVEYDDHVGSRLKFQDGRGRSLFYNAGIPGEFAEGADLRSTVPLLNGDDGSLYGAGSVWILTWDEGGPCGDHVVIGNGFTESGFVVTMTSAGLLEPGD